LYPGPMQSTLSLVESRARELDGLKQAVIATDAEGQIIYWNDEARRLYGWSSEEALHRPVTEVTPTPLSRAEAARILETLRLGKHWSGAFPVTRKDGSNFVAHVVDAPVRDDEGEIVGIIGISSDVSPIVRLQHLARDLSAALTPTAVARVALDAALEFSGAAAGSFMITNREGTALEALDTRGYSAEVMERYHSIPADAAMPIAIAARALEPLFVGSAAEWMERFPAVAGVIDPRTRSWIALPLRIGPRSVGAIGLSVRIERAFTEDDRGLLVAVSQHAAVAVERALLFDAERLAREEAEVAQRRAEDATRVKSAFLATMSHELRTPLGAIIGYSDLMADEILGPVNDAQRQHLKRLRNSATHLLSLIDEVLTYSRLEAEREVVHPERGQLGKLVESVNEIVMPLARAKGLDCSVEVADPGVELVTDLRKLKQILVNLAGNAVKYTERGQVKLTYAVSGGTLTASVSDTGIGISPEHLAHVFDPFWQADVGKRQRQTGSGLGLSVSRSLATLLGGELRARSEPGQGSVFTLEVPAVLR
jgi:PAS domain S-box-containing protein